MARRELVSRIPTGLRACVSRTALFLMRPGADGLPRAAGRIRSNAFGIEYIYDSFWVGSLDPCSLNFFFSILYTVKFIISYVISHTRSIFAFCLIFRLRSLKR